MTQGDTGRVNSVLGLRRRYERERTGGVDLAEEISVWGGGMFCIGALAAWVLSGRDVGWAHGAMIEPSWAVAAALGCAVAMRHVLTLVGPLAVDAATVHWLASTPVARRRLLRTPIAVTGLTSAVVGVLVARILALASGALLWWPLGVLGAAVGLTTAALAIAGQCSPRVARWVRRLDVPASATAGVVVATSTSLGPSLLPVVSVVAAVVAAVSWCVVVARSGSMRRAALNSGTTVRAAAHTSVVLADIGLVPSAVEAQAYMRRGAVRSRWLPRGAFRALVFSDILRHCRIRSVWIVGGISAVVVAAAGSALPLGPAEVISLVAAYCTVSAASVGLRDVLAPGSVRDLYPVSDAALVSAFAVVPVATALVFSLLIAVTVSITAAIVVGLCASAAVYRSRTAPPVVVGGLEVMTSFGLIPVDVLRQQLRGPGLLLVGTLVLALL